MMDSIFLHLRRPRKKTEAPEENFNHYNSLARLATPPDPVAVQLAARRGPVFHSTPPKRPIPDAHITLP
jgi:hypothetical protein